MTRTEIIAAIVVVTIALAMIFPSAGGLLIRFLATALRAVEAVR